jgi:phospholipase C
LSASRNLGAYALLLSLFVIFATADQRKGSREYANFNKGLKKVRYIIVVYQENWSFDGLYGQFVGANGLSSYYGANAQVDKDGVVLNTLPQVLNDFDYTANPPVSDVRFPPANGNAALPVRPFDLKKYISTSDTTGDLVHRFYTEQLQINSGKMDGFVAWSNNGGLVLSYFDASNLPEGRLAQQYVLCDNFFHSAFGGSFLNHQFLIAAAAPRWENPPPNLISDPDPKHLKDNVVTPEGYAVNTVFSVNSPHPANIEKSDLLPEQTNPTIGDRLSAKRVSWKWYSGGWDAALAGHPDPLFQFHHQPFVYYTNFKDGTKARKDHLQDETRFFADLKRGQLPSVSFIKPLGPDNEHPGYATLLRGQQHVAEIVEAVRRSNVWGESVIIITYDENGGRWDHVAPPVGDKFGPGTRVPTIVISAFAKKRFVDHSQYETLSILRFIELRFGLTPLSQRDAESDPLMNVFDFGPSVP